MILVSSYVHFKEGKEKELYQEFQHIQPKLQCLIEEMAFYVHNKGHKFIITDLLSDAFEDARLGRVSTSHSEGRAVDIRTRDFPREFIKEFEKYFESKYGHMGAISKKTGNPNLVYWHNSGHGEHFHVQIKRG
jgi:hypothetical protein